MIAGERGLVQLGHAPDREAIQDLVPPICLGIIANTGASSYQRGCQFGSFHVAEVASVTRDRTMRRISAGLQRADPVARRTYRALGEARMLLTLHNIIAGFLRRTWLIAAVTVVVCAAFAAHAVAALSDAALASPAPTAFTDRTAVAPASRAAPPALSPAPRRAPPDGTSFAARNIYCSACAPAGPGPGPGSYQGQPAILIATSLGNEPRATVRVLPTEVQGSWGLGEEIPGVGRLDDIDATAIEVADAAGHSRLISLLDIGGPGGPGGPAIRRRLPASIRGPFADRYTKLNDTTFEVDRSLIRELVDERREARYGRRGRRRGRRRGPGHPAGRHRVRNLPAAPWSCAPAT